MVITRLPTMTYSPSPAALRNYQPMEPGLNSNIPRPTDLYAPVRANSGLIANLGRRLEWRILRLLGRSRGFARKIVELPQRRSNRKPTRGDLAARIKGIDNPKIACLVLHGSAQPEWSIANFVDAAVSANHTPLLIYNGNATDETRARLSRLAVMVERPNFGHDFGAYQEVALALTELKSASFESVVLANDSVFYPDSFHEIFESTVQLPGDVTSITSSMSPRFHLQTYFFRLNQVAAYSDPLVRFWRQYTPTSVRSDVIRKGELKLSRTIYRSNHSMQAFVDTRTVLRNWFQTNNEAAMDERLTALISPKFHEYLQLSSVEESDELARTILTDDLNPTHAWGLVLHDLLGIPIKKDLWKSVPINFLFPSLKNYSEDQLNDIAFHLESEVARFKSYGIRERADFVVGNR